MKLSLAQIRPHKGDIDRNIALHRRFIDLAVGSGADIIVFPELSLTGYEPEMSKELATDQNDPKLGIFQDISDAKGITICLGLPTTSEKGVMIGMVIFQAQKGRLSYSKQHLHADELPYFVGGDIQVIFEHSNRKISPAICYESLLSEHAEMAHEAGAQFYLASVAKSQKGLEKAYKHYSNIAHEYSMYVLMANSIGYCDNFESAGQSAVWNTHGKMVAQLDEAYEGVLIFDDVTNEVIVLDL